MPTFNEKLQAKWNERKFVCVGLDGEPSNSKFPQVISPHPWASPMLPDLEDAELEQLKFNCHIIDATKDLVLAYKPNLAFYRGAKGKRVLELTIYYIHMVSPDVVVILDAKQADIGNTNDGYVVENFDYYQADAVTLHPYLGQEALKPFLDCAEKGAIVLVRTSNPGAGELQDLRVEQAGSNGDSTEKCFLYEIVAKNVSRYWNYNGNCAAVVGATYPEELAHVRAIVGDGFPILIPGIGAQGGDLEATVRAGRDSKSQGMIINSSRGIIFASSGEDFAEAARSETLVLHEAITAVLDTA